MHGITRISCEKSALKKKSKRSLTNHYHTRQHDQADDRQGPQAPDHVFRQLPVPETALSPGILLVNRGAYLLAVGSWGNSCYTLSTWEVLKIIGMAEAVDSFKRSSNRFYIRCNY